MDIKANKPKVIIKPYNNTQVWTVEAYYTDSCTALVDFNVPGKPNPPPVNLRMVIKVQRTRLEMRKYCQNFDETLKNQKTNLLFNFFAGNRNFLYNLLIKTVFHKNLDDNLWEMQYKFK